MTTNQSFRALGRAARQAGCMSFEVIRFVERAVGHVLSAKEIKQAMAGWNAERTGSEAA